MNVNMYGEFERPEPRYAETGTVEKVERYDDGMTVVLVGFDDGTVQRFATTSTEVAVIGRRVINIEGVGIVVAA